MAGFAPKRLRVAAISFLNPAPLMWDFEHPPRAPELAARYDIHYTAPALCAAELHTARAGLGLIPIAALTPELAIVPGCAIASLDRVRSIQLIIKRSVVSSGDVPTDAADPAALNRALQSVRTVAADTASRSSIAYAQVLFRRFANADPAFTPAPADPIAMLHSADSALLIGDPALLALQSRARIEADPAVGPCLWIDLAHQWRIRTGLPWVAAVWAARPELVAEAGLTSAQLIHDLNHSRDSGLAQIPALVDEWSPRIPLPASVIREYLTQNIHYALTPACITAVELFRQYAAEIGALPVLPTLRFL